MGTRNLTMVISGEKTRIAQYGQWDGYPSGQGSVALDFLKNCDINKFKEQLERCRFIESSKRKQTELENFMKKIGAPDGWMTGEQASQYHKKYPFLTRDNGASILNLIYEAEGTDNLWLHDSSDFASDSLFCEWAYVIDLDKNTFEVYEGFNTQPLEEGQRFKDLKCEGGYKPVRMVKSYDINNLPTTEEFIQLEEKEEEA